MMHPVLVMDDTIAFSRLLFSVDEVAVEWPDHVQYTPYGFFIPTNAESASLLDWLEFGPHSPNNYYGAEMYGENRLRGLIIDSIGRLFQLELDTVNDKDGKAFLAFRKTRVLSGPGARYVFSDTVLEHEKAMMSMRLSFNMEEALETWLDNTAIFQHQYNVYDIPAIAEELRDMGFDLPLP